MFRFLLNLFYPKLCASCKKALKESEQTICVSCLMELPKTNYSLDKDNPVAKLFWGKLKLEIALSAFVFVKGGSIQRLMHELKYRGNEDVGELLGVELGKELLKVIETKKIDFVLPVPIHPKKMKIRGYNQCDSIANGVAKVIGSEMRNDILIRDQFAESQTKKTKYERWENVGSVFKVAKPEMLIGKHVIVVDDVVTTGSTLEACCTVLGRIDEITVSIATLANA